MNGRVVTRALRLAGFGASFALAAGSVSARANDRDLVTAPLDPGKRTTLAGERPAWTRRGNARDVAGDMRLDQVSLLLNRTPARQAAFQTLLREQQDPRSPRFHQWLDAREIGERYGASARDVDAVSDWLRSEGLQVESISPGRTRVRISGRSADIARAFDTSLAWFDAAGGPRIGARSAPRVPAAFATAVRGVIGLDAIEFVSSHRAGAPREASAAKDAPRAAGTTCGADGCEHVVFPADLRRIYAMDAAPASGVDGSGVSIAVVARQRVYAPDVAHFQSIADLPQKAAQVIVPPASLDPGDPASTCSTSGGTPACDDPGDDVQDQLEATLDVETAAAAAPGATIKLVVAGNGDDDSRNGVQEAIEYAIDASPPPAQILSISYLSCEPDNGAAVAHYLDDLFAQAAAEGISVFVASGDAGAAGCADHTAAPPAQASLAINVLCASGHVTCVGGTQFADTIDPSRYWSEDNASGYRSALGYIPEGAWNEPRDAAGSPALGGSGGGTSSYIARPDWQNGPGVPVTSGRNTPDVSLTAASHDGYFTCMAAQRGPCTVAGGSFHFLVTSGTSASTPAMAGVAALVGQRQGPGQGNMNPRLYALAANPAAAAFHDVTPASSGVAACDLDVPSLCNNSTAGPTGSGDGLRGYAVTDGYDLATGLGSPNVAQLISAWSDDAAGTHSDRPMPFQPTVTEPADAQARHRGREPR